MIGGCMLCASDVCSIVINKVHKTNEITEEDNSGVPFVVYINFYKGSQSYNVHPHISWHFHNKEVAVNTSILIYKKKLEIELKDKKSKRRRAELSSSDEEEGR